MAQAGWQGGAAGFPALQLLGLRPRSAGEAVKMQILQDMQDLQALSGSETLRE